MLDTRGLLATCHRVAALHLVVPTVAEFDDSNFQLHSDPPSFVSKKRTFQIDVCCTISVLADAGHLERDRVLGAMSGTMLVMAEPRLQFRLLTLIGATFVGCLLMAALCTWPPKYGSFVLLGLILIVPPLLALEVLQCRDYRRAFCIGAMVPCWALLFQVTGSLFSAIFRGGPMTARQFEDARLATLMIWGVAVGCGLVCCLRVWTIRCGERGTNDG